MDLFFCGLVNVVHIEYWEKRTFVLSCHVARERRSLIILLFSHTMGIMEYFEIIGGKKLSGTINVRGSKNAATPILAATLLTTKKCEIRNLPLIEDVFRMLEIIESLGAVVEWTGKRSVAITAKKIDPKKMDQIKVKQLRSSILLLGPLGARCDHFLLPQTGGCVIGARPVGTHFDALAKMGVHIRNTKEAYAVDARKKGHADIVLKEFSVTATENAMMLATGVSGKTVIKIAAAEPHVEDLGRFLRGLGVRITGLGTHTITIHGKKNLGSTTHKIIPDFNEAATFLILGVATKSPLTVRNADPSHLDLVLEKLRLCGADFVIKGKAITIVPPRKILSLEKIEARIYPGIPTDIQAPFGVLATQADGETLIFDTLYEARLKYLSELRKMGAKARILNDHQAVITGPTKLKGKKITSFDLRAGASLIIAALIADGTTRISNAYQVDRGYERIEERLQKIGARIKRKK